MIRLGCATGARSALILMGVSLAEPTRGQVGGRSPCVGRTASNTPVAWCCKSRSLFASFFSGWHSARDKWQMVQIRWHQGHQPCAGAYKFQSRSFGDGKTRFWIPGQTLNDLQSSVLLSAIATSDIWTLTSADRTSDWRLIGHLMIGNLVFAAWWPQGAGGLYYYTMICIILY